MAQPDQAQPPDPQPTGSPPDRHIVSEFHAEVVSGPQGGRFLAVHCFNRREIVLLDFSEDRGAEIVADELRPSKVAMPDGVSRNGHGVVTP